MIVPQIPVQGGQVPPEFGQALQPIIDIIGPFLSIASWLLGGVFGVYLILLLVKIYYEHKRTKILKQIHSDIKDIKLSVVKKKPYSNNTKNNNSKKKNNKK